MQWNYNAEDYKEMEFKPIAPGKYRVRIETVEETTSRTNKPMLKITLAVSGESSRIWYYLLLDSSTPQFIQWTNNKLGRIYDSFDIPAGSMNTSEWEGKVGGALIDNETDNNGTLRARLKYFLKREEVLTLPFWNEGKDDVVPF